MDNKTKTPEGANYDQYAGVTLRAKALGQQLITGAGTPPTSRWLDDCLPGELRREEVGGFAITRDRRPTGEAMREQLAKALGIDETDETDDPPSFEDLLGAVARLVGTRAVSVAYVEKSCITEDDRPWHDPETNGAES